MFLLCTSKMSSWTYKKMLWQNWSKRTLNLIQNFFLFTIGFGIGFPKAMSDKDPRQFPRIQNTYELIRYTHNSLPNSCVWSQSKMPVPSQSSTFWSSQMDNLWSIWNKPFTNTSFNFFFNNLMILLTPFIYFIVDLIIHLKDLQK